MRLEDESSSWISGICVPVREKVGPVWKTGGRKAVPSSILLSSESAKISDVLDRRYKLGRSSSSKKLSSPAEVSISPGLMLAKLSSISNLGAIDSLPLGLKSILSTLLVLDSLKKLLSGVIECKCRSFCLAAKSLCILWSASRVLILIELRLGCSEVSE